MANKVELKRMFVKAAAIVACTLIPTISFASQDTDAMKPAQTEGSRVYMVKGSVFVKPGKSPAHRVIGDEIIGSDTLVSTGDDSAALLKFEDGQIVTMRANSTFHVREYRYNASKIEDSNIIFSLLKGGMRFVTGLIGQRKKQAFRLLTPNATMGIRGTEFMVAMVDKSLYSKVQTGKISMTNAAGVSVLGAGQSAVVKSSTVLASIVSASAIPAGTFSDLVSIPLDPSAIPVPVPVPAPISIPAPVPVPLPEPAAMVATQAAEPPPEVITEETAVERGSESKSGIALTGKIGTLGAGGELNLGISDSFSARFGINAYRYKYNTSVNSINYDFDLNLQTVSALADWYPFQGSFRTTGGVFYDNNKVSLGANPTNSSYLINGMSYSSTGISNLLGRMSFNPAAPYLGIGWGNPVASGKGLGITTDIGILFQGKPRIDMSATCTLGAQCTQFSIDLEAERLKIENNLSKFTFWPVVSIGISYQW